MKQNDQHPEKPGKETHRLSHSDSDFVRRSFALALHESVGEGYMGPLRCAGTNAGLFYSFGLPHTPLDLLGSAIMAVILAIQGGGVVALGAVGGMLVVATVGHRAFCGTPVPARSNKDSVASGASRDEAILEAREELRGHFDQK